MAKNHNRHQKSRIRINLEFYGFWLLYKLLHALSLRTAYRISCALLRFMMHFDRRHHNRTVSHLMHAGLFSDRKEALRFARRSYTEFGKLIVEIVKMDQLYSPDKIYVEGPEATLDYMLPERNPQGPRNVIIVTAHLGNWEVAGTAFSQKNGVPMTSLMRAFSNPRIGEMILAHRASATHTLVDKTKGVRPLLRALLNHETATVLIDQHAANREGVVCEFFGHPARVHMTPALLHLKTGTPILPELTVRRPGDNFEFTVVVDDLIRYTPTGNKEHDVEALTQLCISRLEAMIRRYPEQWLWAPRHWLDIDRRNAEQYKDWKPKQY